MAELKTIRGKSGSEYLVIKVPRKSGLGYTYEIFVKKTPGAGRKAAFDCGAQSPRTGPGTTNQLWDQLFKGK